MIQIMAPGARERHLIKEILAPLGQAVHTYTRPPEPGDEAPSLAVIWQDTDIKNKNSESALIKEAGRVIMILPAGADDETRSDAHDAGADAVFVAPVRPGLITDQARTFINMAAQADLPAQLPLGPYDFHPRENALINKKSKEKQRLTDKERDILLTLLTAEGMPVTRQALLDAVWAYAPGVETHTLETHIYRLRQKIEIDPADPQIVLTDEIGYKILKD